ncbi:hypothetical protein ACSCB1_35430 [Streptomyces europaeiscabiei]|uniref:hypothetical protein n=1 Tax=Streptomyces europaeiscabiei TaxID=146819 RepID=UPI0006283DE6|nr:hypothetical protein [Streptomyces europaeiscabiei]
MSRLDMLPAERAESFMRELREELTNLKQTTQYIGGASLLFHTSEANTAYDWEGTLYTPGGAAAPKAVLMVKATALTQEHAFCDLIPELYADGKRYTRADYYDLVSPVSFYDLYPQPANVLKRNERQWMVVIIGANTTSTYGMKFRVVGNDDMTIDVEQVYP